MARCAAALVSGGQRVDEGRQTDPRAPDGAGASARPTALSSHGNLRGGAAGACLQVIFSSLTPRRVNCLGDLVKKKKTACLE